MPSGKRDENPKNGISPCHEKIKDLSETAFGVSGRYPKKSGEGRKKICALSSSGKVSQEGEGWLFALVRPGGHEPAPYLTLSGAQFSSASTPDIIVTIWVFGVADYESEVRFSKFKMADPTWRSKFSKKGNLMRSFGYKG